MKKEPLLSGKINPAKKQGLYFTIPTWFLYNPLWRIGKPISVGAFHLGGSVSRIRFAHPTMWKASTKFGLPIPQCGKLQPNSVCPSHNVESFNQIRFAHPTMWVVKKSCRNGKRQPLFLRRIYFTGWQ
jgi:hypothetical protein